MTIRRITSTAAALAASVLILTGCTSTQAVDTAPRTVKLDNGTEVTCVLAIDQVNGGSASPSCNWERYNQQHPVSSSAAPRPTP